MVTVAPGLTAIGYLYPCEGLGPAPFGSTEFRALMMYSDPTTRSRCLGVTGFADDASAQESIRGLPGLLIRTAGVRCDCVPAICAAVEHPAARPATMASAIRPIPAVLLTAFSLHPRRAACGARCVHGSPEVHAMCTIRVPGASDIQ